MRQIISKVVLALAASNYAAAEEKKKKGPKITNKVFLLLFLLMCMWTSGQHLLCVGDSNIEESENEKVIVKVED